MKYFFMSFRDVDENKNLGVCIVQEEDSEKAVQKATELGINPGGEVLLFELDDEEFRNQGLNLNTLYSRSQMRDLGFHVGIAGSKTKYKQEYNENN